jgi:hypothetical protein
MNIGDVPAGKRKWLFIAVILLSIIFVSAVLTGRACHRARSRKLYLSEKPLYSLNDSEHTRLSIEDTAGLPRHYRNTGPVFEKLFGGVSKQPMSATRVYPDGAVLIYGNMRGSEEYRWKEVGKLPQNRLDMLYELLRSDTFAEVVVQAQANGTTDFAGNVWRSLVDGQAVEVSTSPRDGGGQIPEILHELTGILYEAR